MQQISAIDIIIETDSQRYFSTEGLQLTNTEIRLNASLNASCCSPSWLINRNILEDIHLNLHSLVCLIISQYYYHSSADPAVVNQRYSNRNWNKVTFVVLWVKDVSDNGNTCVSCLDESLTVMTQFCLFKYFLDCGHMCAVQSSLINWAESVVTGKTLIHTGSHDTPLFTQSLTKPNIYQIKQCNSFGQYYSSQKGILMSIFWCSKTLFCLLWENVHHDHSVWHRVITVLSRLCL